jgi:hypothetical protein
MARYLILREFAPSSAFEITPPHSYIDGTNGTLERQAVVVRTDSNGFMVTNRQPSPDDKRVLIVGGSSIENLYIPADQRIAAVVERELDAKQFPTRVLNGGVSDMHLLHALNLLLNKGLALELDALVYVPTANLDILANETPGSFWTESNQFLTPIRTSGAASSGENSPKQFINTDGFRTERRLLATLADICRNFEIDLTFATWPIYDELDAYARRVLTDRATVDAFNAQCRNLNEVIRECAAERKVRLLELAGMFVGLPHADYFYDWNHPNVQGCDAIGTHISHVLHEAFFSA